MSTCNVLAASLVPVSGGPQDLMKPNRNFALNLVAMAMVFYFMTPQAAVSATSSANSHTVCIKRHWFILLRPPPQDLSTGFIPFQIVKMQDHDPILRFRRQTSHRNRGFLSLLSDYISEVNMNAIAQGDTDTDTLKLICTTDKCHFVQAHCNLFFCTRKVNYFKYLL
jgi:hypothetical protein